MFWLHVSLAIIYVSGTQQGQKKVSDPFKLELHMGMWMLGIEPGLSGRAEGALNHKPLLQYPQRNHFKNTTFNIIL